MAIYFADSAVGDDANPGTATLPKLTIAAAKALMTTQGDTLYLSGGITTPFREATTFTNYSNTTIAQAAGRTQAWIRGDTDIGTAGWTTTGTAGVYVTTAAYAAVAAAAAHVYVLFNWSTAVNANGSRTATCVQKASVAAVNAAASGAKGASYWDIGVSNKIYAYFGGADPRTAGVETSYVSRTTVGANVIGLMIFGGSNNTVDGINFGAWHQTGQGGSCWIENNQGSVITNCGSWDCGNHAFIFYGGTTLNKDNSFSRCTADGGLYNNAYFTFYNQNALGATSNLVGDSCTTIAHEWLGLDGLKITANDNAQLGYYSHADSGTGMRGIVWRNCNFTLTDSTTGNGHGSAYASNNGPLVSSESAADYTGARVIGGLATIAASVTAHNGLIYQAGSMAFTGTRFINTGPGFPNRNAAGLGFINLGYDAPGAIARDWLFESCVFIARMDNVNNNALISLYNGATGQERAIFNNCSFLNIGTAAIVAQPFFDQANVDRLKVIARRCIFRSNLGDYTTMFWSDGAISLANHGTFDNCVYSNVSLAGAFWCQLATIDTKAEWFASVDTAAVDMDGQTIFPGYASDGLLDIANGPLALLVASSTTSPPSSGIDAPYARRYGAYQGDRHKRAAPPAVRRAIAAGRSFVRGR